MTLIDQFNAIATTAARSRVDRPVVMLFGKARDLGIFGRIVKYLSQIGRQSELRHSRNEKVAKQIRMAISEHYGDKSNISARFDQELDRLIDKLRDNQKSLLARDVAALVTTAKQWENQQQEVNAKQLEEIKQTNEMMKRLEDQKKLEDQKVWDALK